MFIGVMENRCVIERLNAIDMVFCVRCVGIERGED